MAIKTNKLISSASGSPEIEIVQLAKIIDGKIYDIDGDEIQVTGTSEAEKLKTARTIQLSGDVSGDCSFDGSEDVTINVTNPTKHSHSNKTYLDTINQNMSTGDTPLFESININGAYTLPNSDGVEGQYLVTDGSGNLSWQSRPLTYTWKDGDNRNDYTVTASSGILHSGDDDPEMLVDGNNSNDTYFNNNVNVANKYIEISFDNNKQYAVSNFKWKQNNNKNHGTWKLQGFANGSWLDISDNITLGEAEEASYPTNSNDNKFEKVRLLGVSGQTNTSPWLYEFQLEVGE